MNTNHPLFQEYPLDGKAKISTGEVPTPYHIYDGHASLIGGTANLDVVTELVRGERVTPIRDEAGRALMALWVCDFTEASLGAHTEVQVSFFVTRGEAKPIKAHPLALIKPLLFDADLLMLCHGLWNNTDQVVAYNRELLGLPARKSEGEFWYKNGLKCWDIKDAESGERITGGGVRVEKQTPPETGFAMLGVMGFGGAMKAAQMKQIGMRVVNPISEAFARNMEARAITAPGNTVVQLVDAYRDELSLDWRGYPGLDFKPTFIEHLDGFKFVYLMPE